MYTTTTESIERSRRQWAFLPFYRPRKVQDSKNLSDLPSRSQLVSTRRWTWTWHLKFGLWALSIVSLAQAGLSRVGATACPCCGALTWNRREMHFRSRASWSLGWRTRFVVSVVPSSGCRAAAGRQVGQQGPWGSSATWKLWSIPGCRLFSSKALITFKNYFQVDSFLAINTHIGLSSVKAF